MDSNNSKSTKSTFKQRAWLFFGGASAGAIVALFGGLWQVAHFWWIMTAMTLVCGLLAVVFRQNFEKMLDAFSNNSPWL